MTARQKGQRVTCVFCRAHWVVESTGAGAGVGRKGAAAPEGYVNLADAAGVSTARDTSSCRWSPSAFCTVVDMHT